MTRLTLKRALLGAAAGLSLSLGAPAMAADHRDAPTIDDYSAIDINDVYMFRMPADCQPGQQGCKLVVALTTQAVGDPLFASSYHFQENALYRLNFTTTATGFPNVSANPTAMIDFTFGPFANGQQTFHALFSPSGITADGLAVQGTAGETHIDPTPFIQTMNNVKIFAGPREDPFFFDLVGFNRSIGSGTNQFTGVDAFLGKIVNAIVVEMPIETVFPAGTCGSTASTSCGVWALTYLDAQGQNQVDRMGNPAVNTALIPAPRKDPFNFAQPSGDASFVPDILRQIVNLDAKFRTCKDGNTTGASACGPNLLACAVACNPNVPLLASVAVPDILRFVRDQSDGYPNGRRLFDRTTDLLINLIVQIPNFTDGTDVKEYCLPQPDKHGKFHHEEARKHPAVFPYLGPPLQLDDRKPFHFAEQSCP